MVDQLNPRRTWLPIVAFLLAGVQLSSCNYVRNVGLLRGGEVREQNFAHTVSFEYESGLVLVDAVLQNRAEPNRFIFDTGAFNSKIESDLADMMGLETRAVKQNSDTHGTERRIEVVRLDSLRLGAFHAYSIGAGKVVYDSLSAGRCYGPDGIVGGNLIKLANWRIDYENREMLVTDSEIDVPEGAAVLAFDRPALSGTPRVEIRVGGRTVGNVLVDVGSNGGLRLPKTVSSQFPAEDVRLFADESVSGIYGVRSDTIVVKNLPVSLGDSEFSVPVRFTSGADGLLGNDILEHFVVWIDNDRNRILLEPRSPVEVDAPGPMLPGVLNDSTWIVRRAEIGGPYALGDTLGSVHGRKPGELFGTYCEWVRGIRTFLETVETDG